MFLKFSSTRTIFLIIFWHIRNVAANRTRVWDGNDIKFSDYFFRALAGGYVHKQEWCHGLTINF